MIAEGKLFLYNPPTLYNRRLDGDSIAYISCDEKLDDRVPNNATEAVLLAAEQNVKAIILYSTFSDTCTLLSQNGSFEREHMIFEMGDRRASMWLRDQTEDMEGLDIQITFDRNRVSSEKAEGPATEEPGNKGTTAALLVLYCVTGVISGLFLLILVSGAIRARRNPERYGRRPTDHLGVRQRQSRARGIARAVLDTIPIVRFGPKPELEQSAKEADVEMQDRREGSRESSPDSIAEVKTQQRMGDQVHLQVDIVDKDSSNSSIITPIPTPSPVNGVAIVDSQSGQIGSGITTPGDSTPLEVVELDPHQLQCPVCMDDFEDGQELRVLPCRHSFHPSCIDPWLLNVAGSCPLCRIDLRPPTEREDSTASILPPPPPSLPSVEPQNRLLRLLEVARGSSSREERLAALRAVREENTSHPHPTASRIPRSRVPEFGITRLRRAIFSRTESSVSRSGNSETGEAVNRSQGISRSGSQGSIGDHRVGSEENLQGRAVGQI